MSSSVDQPVSAAALAAPFEDLERRALVQRVAASRHFAKAHQLREILLYLMERALLDPPAAIHEQEIACNVLGRKADFNAHEDNIVRVQVSHLRKRLDEYFTVEGSSETIIVSVPRGGYSLKFEPRPLSLETVPAPAVPEPTPELRPELMPSAPPAKKRPAGYFLPAAFLIAVVLSAAGGWSLRRFPPARTASPSLSSPLAVNAGASDDLLWPHIFSGQTTDIVVTDTCLVMLQDILDTDIQLSGYLDGQYPGNLLGKAPGSGLQKALREISSRQYTSLGDLNSTQHLTELSHRYTSHPLAIRYARHMNVRDFKTGNFVLLGSRRGIPWVRLFDSQMNFSLEEDQGSKSFYFRNRTPQSGEPDAWRQQANADNTLETYADIALLPNLGNTGHVLILSGIGMAASEAAAEFVTGPEFQKALAAILPKSGSHSELRYFEMLLRTRAVAGAARSSQVVSSRVLGLPASGS